MVNWQNAGRMVGKAFPVVANTIGVPFDYMAGKAEGEDDFRAGAGAVASGLGGWKGALAGAGAGAALGPAGALAGGIIGGMAGSFAGGWTADRADEFVRGKNTGRNNAGARNNMSQAVQLENGDVAEVDDNGNLIGWLVKGGIVVAGSEALYNIGGELRNAYGQNRLNANVINPSGIGKFNNAAAFRQTLVDAPGVMGKGAVNSRAGQMVRALPTWGKVAAGALVADQLTGGNVTNAVGRALGGGADMIANAVGFKTDFDGQNQMSQQAMKEDREQQRIEQNRGIQNPYDDEMYKRYRMMSEDAFNRENAIWNRNKDEAWRVADKADEVSRRNYLTNFTANQANALLQGYMTDIPNSVNNSLRTVFSARYN